MPTALPDGAQEPPRPGAALHWLTAIWAVAAIVMALFGYATGILGLPLFFFGAALGVAWCFLAFVRLIVRGGILRLDASSAAAWAFCPATGLLLGTMCLTHRPLPLRVKLSESALLRLVEDVRAGRTDLDGPVRAGLFVIDHAYVEGGCVFLDTNEGAWPMASEGIVHAPEGRPPGHALLTHLQGPWWHFYYPD